MQGAEDAEERGAEGTEGPRGWGLRSGSPSPVEVGFGEALCVRFAHFVTFCKNYDSLRLMKFI